MYTTLLKKELSKENDIHTHHKLTALELNLKCTDLNTKLHHINLCSCVMNNLRPFQQ